MSVRPTSMFSTGRATGVVVTAIVVVALTAMPTQASTWTIESTPNPVSGHQGDYNDLVAVDCASASACMAVGSAYDANTAAHMALAVAWDGTSWRLTNPSSEAYLDDVSCVNASTCFAVGDLFDGSGVVALRWNGKKWSTTNLARTQQSMQHLAGVDCASATSCLAVGWSSDGGGSTYFTLVYHYNGSRWSIVKSPNPKPANISGHQFQDVACVRAAKCYVAGATATKTLVERWSGGTNWKRMSTPTPSDTPDLYGIACASATSCVAVGETYGAHTQALALIYNSTGWHKRRFTEAESIFNGVSCTAKACIAVGSQGTPTRSPFVERYAGGKWHAMTAPGDNKANYRAIHCWSGSSCQAVGNAFDTNASEGRTFAAVHP